MKLTITGHNPRVLLDGEPVMRLLGFKLIGDEPYQPLRLVLELDPEEVEVDIDGGITVERIVK